MKQNLKIFAEKVKNKLSKESISAFFADKRKRRRFILLSVIAAVILATVIFAIVYVNDYYRVDSQALLAYTSAEHPNENIRHIRIEDGTVTVIPTEIKAGFIFYPGGKVEYTSYLPLMVECAERGILSILVEMPCNLAVLDVNRASGITEQFPEVTEWYIGGHSLGGSMAASYLADNTDEIDGLILLGSYSTADVSASRVLSIYGSNDGVMNREKYEKYKPGLPADLTETVIDGGNHAYFGIYGEQKGDGVATISQSEQIDITASHIAEFILK